MHSCKCPRRWHSSVKLTFPSTTASPVEVNRIAEWFHLNVRWNQWRWWCRSRLSLTANDVPKMKISHLLIFQMALVPPHPAHHRRSACSGRREFQMFLTESSQWPLSRERSALPPVPRCLFPSDLEVRRRDTSFSWGECEMPVCQIGSARRCAARYERQTPPRSAHLAAGAVGNHHCSRFSALTAAHRWNVVRCQNLKKKLERKGKSFPVREIKNHLQLVTSQGALTPFSVSTSSLLCFGCTYKHREGPAKHQL